jgi:anti-sigma B factor antagonist
MIMKAERIEMGQATVLRIDGDIDESGVNGLRLCLLECIKEKRVNLVMNLEDVQFVSYLGLGVMVERLRQVRAQGGDMRLVGINLALERMLRMVGVASVFEVYESENQAILSYREAA